MILVFFLLLLLVWFLNREFEVSYRLHYHGDVEADLHRTKIQSMRDQADWLLRFYGFEARELISEERPYFNVLMDPKCDWALRHLDLFPVEVTRASYADLLRVPGIGVKSARRILSARRYSPLDFDVLKKLGVVLKRAGYFITCGGKTWRPLKFEEDYLTGELVAEDRKKRYRIEDPDGSYRQMSLFDDFHLGNAAPSPEDVRQSLFGQL